MAELNHFAIAAGMGACLFVAGTENIEESIVSQRRIAEVPLFQPELWQPNPNRMSWQYVEMPDSKSDYRFGVVRSLVGRWQPVFNIPRGKTAA